MDIVDLLKSTLAEWQSIHRTNLMNFITSIVSLIILIKIVKPILSFTISLLGWPLSIFYPMNYELDMTTKDFCKTIAEVDNQLAKQLPRFKQNDQTSGSDSRPSARQSVGAIDCTTGLPGGHRTLADDSDQVLIEQGTARGANQHLYPNGWLPVMESTKVKPGTIERAILMGRDLIVTRSLEGKVDVLDAYCPHIGVHIGVGGKVVKIESQSCVQCPFHGWTFRASDGQCVHIPYLKHDSKSSIPKQAKLNTWISVEVDNFIYIWHHIDGQPPNWSLVQTEELLSKSWVLAGRSCHKTNLEIRDMLENGADMNHFEGIHNDLFFFGGNFLQVQAFNFFQDYFRHHWSPDWQPVVGEDGKVTHMAEMSLLSWISFFKTRIFNIQVKATQIGPACVSLRYDSNWYGKGILKMNAIPLGGRRTMYIQHIYTENKLSNRFMAKWVLYGEIMQLERDFFIWNHKKNIKNPIFVPEDKILKRFRIWYSQFYKRKRHIKVGIDDEPTKTVSKNLSRDCFRDMHEF